MKKIVEKFANSLLSKEQMKSVKGGTTYCNCGGTIIGVPDGSNCIAVCCNYGIPHSSC